MIKPRENIFCGQHTITLLVWMTAAPSLFVFRRSYAFSNNSSPHIDNVLLMLWSHDCLEDRLSVVGISQTVTWSDMAVIYTCLMLSEIGESK